MHAGNVFSALVSWILARRSGGRVVLRIEDLDAGRSRAEFADQVMRDFERLGLTWDEGPFYQSSREGAYRAAADALDRQGAVYPCFCTRADLHAASAPHAGERPLYAGTCRGLSPAQRAERLREVRAQGREPSLRLAVPDERYSLDDLFQGPYSQDLARECGDFVIRRSDGAFAYQLAVVVDDAAQGVDCVVRGCDLLSSAPQQMYLQDLLGLPRPAYAHVPLLLGPDGRRLSKRHADAGLRCLEERFGSPEGVLGHIAFVSGMAQSDAPASAEELCASANLDALRGVRAIAWR